MKRRNERSENALIEAARIGDEEAAERLLREGASPSERDASGRSAALAAAQANETNILRLLLAAGADPEERTEDPWTKRKKGLLAWAAENDAFEAMRTLEEFGARPSISCGTLEEPALMSARGARWKEICVWLTERGAEPDDFVFDGPEGCEDPDHVQFRRVEPETDIDEIESFWDELRSLSRRLKEKEALEKAAKPREARIRRQI